MGQIYAKCSFEESGLMMIMVVVVRAQMMMVVVTMDFAHLERPWESCWSENKGFCDSLASQRERAEGDQLA